MSRTILIVDDEPEMISVLQKALETYRESFHVLAAGDGEEALDVLRERDISLVITDLVMPKMDGFTLLVHIRSDFPGIPVIIMTAHSQPVMKRMAWKIGVAEYIEKPFSFNGLADRIMAVLGESDQSYDKGAGEIEIPLFLQLIDVEKKTCTVNLMERSSRREGELCFQEGRLVDARLEGFSPEKAVFEMLTWNDAVISMGKGGHLMETRLSMSLQDIMGKA